MTPYRYFLLIFVLILSGCSDENQEEVRDDSSCISCHKSHKVASHKLKCIVCHKGNDVSKVKDIAHSELIAAPAHPDNMTEGCGSCHLDQVDGVKNTVHFTLANSVNLFRLAFGASDILPDFRKTPSNEIQESALLLADDLLRRRCFVCHPFSKGEPNPKTSHATGCGACHLSVSNGNLDNHIFHQPKDEQCLSCHYGNYVGFDYYGRYEHDLNAEYRTPFLEDNSPLPYGIEYHQLKPDIHQQKGMICIDCHSGGQLMYRNGDKPSCSGCHDTETLQRSLPNRVSQVGDSTFVLDAVSGTRFILPLLKHPAHFNQIESISCQGCHAQWTFNDSGKHFLRSDTDDYDTWWFLANQGSKEVQTIIENNTDYDKTELPPAMTDKLTGDSKEGIWHKGFSTRRWEVPLLGRDDKGTITTMRPVLDYQLSWIDANDDVRFDSIRPDTSQSALRPYVAHTTGSAGLFYNERIELFLTTERSGGKN